MIRKPNQHQKNNIEMTFANILFLGSKLKFLSELGILNIIRLLGYQKITILWDNGFDI